MAKSVSLPRSIHVVTYILLVFVAFALQSNAQTTSTWNDGTGLWSNATDWTPNGVPRNGGVNFYNVIINGTGADTISFDSSGTVINSLSLGPGETLQDNGHSPTLTIGDLAFPGSGSLTNAGTIDWRNGSTLVINAGSTPAMNTGTVNVNNSRLTVNGSFAEIGASSTLTLQNGSLGTIDGSVTGTGTITVDDSKLRVLGNFNDNSLSNCCVGLSLFRGSSAFVAGSFSSFFQNLVVDDSSLAIQGSVLGLGPISGASIQNGGTLAVHGNFDVGTEGVLSLSGRSSMTVGGSMINIVSWVLLNNSNLTVQGDYDTEDISRNVLANGSTLTVKGTFTNGNQLQDSGFPATCTGATSLCLSGSGTEANLHALQNNSYVEVDAGSLLKVGSGGFTNNGTVNVTGGGGLIINSGPTPAMNSGAMNVTGSNLTVRGGFAESGGPFPGTPTLTLQNGSVGTITGSVSGYGTINVDDSKLRVLGNFNTFPYTYPSTGCCLDADVSLSLSKGSSAFIGGNLAIPFGSLSMDDSALTVGGSYIGNTNDVTAIIQNGSTLTVLGAFGVGSEGDISISGSSVRVGGSMESFLSNIFVNHSTLTIQGSYSGEDYATLNLTDASTLTVKGTLTNGNPLYFDTGGVGCIVTSLCLLGAGNIASAYAVQSNAYVEVDAGSLLAVGRGGFANNSYGTVNLGGLLTSAGGFNNNGGTVVTAPGSALITSTYLQNTGSTDVSGTLVAKSYQQSGGSTVIETGGIVTANTFSATGGTVTVNGILDPTAVEIGSRGTLQGSGIVNGNVFNHGNVIAGTLGNPLTFNINGNYTQNATGIFTELVGSKGNNLLNVSGTATLIPGASLNVQLVGGYDPKNGTTFTVMDYGSEKGTFTLSDPYFDNGKQQWVVSYGTGGSDNVFLTAEATKVVTPEPSTILLVGTALLGMAGYAKKRRNSV